MTSVVISSKFQVVIPRAVRQQLKLKVGQRVHVRANEAGQVVIEPELDIMSARGILPLIPGVDIAHIENDPEGVDFTAECEKQSLRIAQAEQQPGDLDAWMEEAATSIRGWKA